MNDSNSSSELNTSSNVFNVERNIPFYMCLYIVLFTLSAVLGIAGNLLIIVALLKSKFLRHLRNAFIFNLSFADLMVTGVTMPMSITGVIAGKEFFDRNHFLCLFSAIVCAPGCVASTCSICCIAICRYYYICQYSSYLNYFTKQKTVMYITLIWLFSYCAHLPNHIGWGTVRYSSHFQFCTFDSDNQLYSYFYASFFLVSIIVTAIFYLKIYLTVRKSNLPRQLIVGKKGRSPDEMNLVDEMRLMKASFKIFVVFLIFWAPVTILILSPFKELFPNWVYLYAALAAHSNSTLNVVFYWFDNETFRVAVKNIVIQKSSNEQISMIKNNRNLSDSNFLAINNNNNLINTSMLESAM